LTGTGCPGTQNQTWAALKSNRNATFIHTRSTKSGVSLFYYQTIT
jgi:hypothetical protein